MPQTSVDFSQQVHRERRALQQAPLAVSRSPDPLPAVQRPIDDDAESALAWVMLGNEKDGAPEIRIEHIRMSDQQRTNKTSRGWLIFKIAHFKTRNCDMRFRKLGSAIMSRRGEAKHVLKMTKSQ